MSAEVLAFAEGGVGGVVEEADGEGSGVEVYDFVAGVALWPYHLIHAAQIWPGFHLHDGITFPVEEGHVGVVLKEGSGGGEGFLVVHDGSVDEEGGEVVGRKAVAEEVGVEGVFVVDDAGDHDVADAAVQCSRLTHNVDAANLGNVAGHFGENLIGCHAEGEVYVDDEGVAFGE